MRTWDHSHSLTEINFRSINARGKPGYNPRVQRHHLLPCQLLSQRCFCPMFAAVRRERVGFDDFRRNGLLLPATESASVCMGMPLHRGPHRRYNEMVIARVGMIEANWSQTRFRDDGAALAEALLGLYLLQGALRRQLLAERRRVVLNRKDPLGIGYDFSELDAMAETLWQVK